MAQYFHVLCASPPIQLLYWIFRELQHEGNLCIFRVNSSPPTYFISMVGWVCGWEARKYCPKLHSHALSYWSLRISTTFKFWGKATQDIENISISYVTHLWQVLSQEPSRMTPLMPTKLVAIWYQCFQWLSVFLLGVRQRETTSMVSLDGLLAEGS